MILNKKVFAGSSIAIFLFLLTLLLPNQSAAARQDGRVSDNAPTAGLLEQIELTIQDLLPKAKQESGSGSIYLPIVRTAPLQGWLMPGANPERTSWVPEEVTGSLKPLWFKPFEPFILPRVQIIAAYNTLYVSTSRGLYALGSTSGTTLWVYPTDMPLGHSPTIEDGVVYVGGFDHKIHAIDAFTGQGLWTFEAGSGFDTNPLIVDGLLYAGNRDGKMYAIHTEGANAGQLAWSYQTNGPIHFSAAYKDGVVFFASNDSHAYALDGNNGGLVWKSAKLPGVGFHSWWPVVYEDYVIFAGSNNYRFGSYLGGGSLEGLDQADVYPNHASSPRGLLVGPLGTEPGDWVFDTPTIDTSQSTNGITTPVTEYFEQKPWRRTYLVLNRYNGSEYTTDFDNDGQVEYAPILWFGADGAGNRYPPIVGGDNVLYQTNNYMSDPAIPGGQISGWKLGSPFISVITSDWGAVDEPHAYTAGGDMIYWGLCCDRQAGAINISLPNVNFANKYNAGQLPPTGSIDPVREDKYFGYNLDEVVPGYNDSYIGSPDDVYASYGGINGSMNGVYGYHGDVNPPIPYQGRVYLHRGNSIIAFEHNADNLTELPVAGIVPVTVNHPTIDDGQLKNALEGEVQKILDAGHLKPGYTSAGILDLRGKFQCGDDLIDYWHHPGDVITTLLRALPHLPSGLQQATRDYIQDEYNSFPPHAFNHIGYQSGASREIFDLPPEIVAGMAATPPEPNTTNFEGWNFAPHNFYALWKYAVEFGGAQTIYNQALGKLPAAPSDNILAEMPHVHNAFLAGYLGFLELEELAGLPPSANIVSEYNRLLSLRSSTFTKETSPVYFSDFLKYYCRSLNVSRNFMYLVPEIAQYLQANAYTKVEQAVTEYEYLAPYWFVSKAEVQFGEGMLTHNYDYHSMFQAKAQILGQPQSELTKYLDIPAVPVGDLFYIDNLISAIEAN